MRKYYLTILLKSNLITEAKILSTGENHKVFVTFISRPVLSNGRLNRASDL
jgi:hypothetical protein